MHPTKLDLYAELKCGMVHAGLPGRHLYLSSDTGDDIYAVRDGGDKITHWVFDAKAFYEDFQKACVELMNWGDENVQLNIEEPLLFIY